MDKYKNFSNAAIIAIDIETYDPDLEKYGTSVAKGTGYLLGFSIATDTGFNEYYNIGHTGVSVSEQEKNIQYLKEICEYKNPKKLFFNGIYDLMWITNRYGIHLSGEIHDCYIAEKLINENRESYSLNSVAGIYTNYRKCDEKVKLFCAENNLLGDFRKYLYLMTFDTVYEYAKIDTLLLIDIFKKQIKIIEKESYYNIYRIECDLIHVLLLMYKTGVRIDLDKFVHTKHILQKNIDELKLNLYNQYGNFNFNSSKQIASILEKNNVTFFLTEKGNPNLNKNQLALINSSFTKDILFIRKKEKLLNTFFSDSFTKYIINGRIHCNFNQLQTKTARFSCEKPALQTIPTGSEADSLDESNMCREIYIPEDNCLWAKLDYSQIEFRLLVHYANGIGANEVRNKYIVDKNTDYHKVVMEMTGLPRRESKILNFGIIYGMGAKKCALMNNWDINYTYNLFKKYHEKLPFIKQTFNEVVSSAKNKGFVRTILGRHMRLSDNIKRLNKEYVMLNHLIQSSCADIFKKAMIDSYNAGLFNTLNFHLIVHDEFDISVPNSKIGVEALLELKHIMETCVKISIPLRVDCSVGNNWRNTNKQTFDTLVNTYE